MAIYPAFPPASGFPMLHLEGGMLLRENSYVNVEEKSSVHASMLEPYEWLGSPIAFRLTDESFAIVATRFGIEFKDPTRQQRQTIAETKGRMFELRRRRLIYLLGGNQARNVLLRESRETHKPKAPGLLDKQPIAEQSTKILSAILLLFMCVLILLLFIIWQLHVSARSSANGHDLLGCSIGHYRQDHQEDLEGHFWY